MSFSIRTTVNLLLPTPVYIYIYICVCVCVCVCVYIYKSKNIIDGITVKLRNYIYLYKFYTYI